jgi:ribosome biogenesis GTPase
MVVEIMETRSIVSDGIRDLGYDEQSEVLLDSETLNAHELARVVAVHKDRYVISKGCGDVLAELAGKFIFHVDSATDLPTVGDWVWSDFYDDDTHAIIHDLVPRKSLLRRKTAGKNIDYQLIGANIDVAFIIQSLDDNFNPRRLERYLVMIHESGIVPVVLFSKSDLLSGDEVNQKLARISDLLGGLEAVSFSNATEAHLEQIERLLLPRKTYCLVGSSGVGKSTLLNRLLGSDQIETQPVREKDSKGRHTTTHRQLIRLRSGAMVIDTPGMRELGNFFVDSGIGETFAEIAELETQCKFKNCSHRNERGCAIRAAIDVGALSEKRYENYEAMQREAAYNEMSYYEKRQKDRDFGKLIKSVQKYKRKK